MDVGAVTSTTAQNVSTYQSTGTSAKSEAKSSKEKSNYGSDKAAVYEKSDSAKNAKANKALIAKLKADTEDRLAKMQSLVTEMLSKQGIAVKTADDMWKALANGDFTVDEQTAKEAQEAISEDGYWGVEQTSQRIFDFAYSLSGGDEEKMGKMIEAFKKGYDQATKAWGKDLPDISSKTYDAVMEKYQNFKDGLNVAE